MIEGKKGRKGAGFIVKSAVALAVAVVALVVSSAPADVTFTGSGLGNDAGETNSASVTFGLSISGTTTNLIVTLTNTARYDPNDPSDILTAVFFSLMGNPTLVPTSAVLNAGSLVKGNGGLTDPGGVVGGEWAYSATVNSNSLPSQGASSVGLGLFGAGNRFPGSNLEGPASPDGVQYGISTAFDTSGNDNGGIAGVGLITNSVVLTLANVPSSIHLTDISNVVFQYGSGLDEPSYPGQLIPEPNTLTLTAAGIFLLGFLKRRRC